MTSTLPVYDGWRAVPHGLMTASQLTGLDLPRTPGPIVGYVKTSNYRGKRAEFPLHALADAELTTATAIQLAAADRRRTTSRACVRCGAVPDRPLTADGSHCPACARITWLDRQIEINQQWRARAIEWALEVIADPTVIYVHTRQLLRHAAPSGRRNLDPVAIVVDAANHAGVPLMHVTVRLAGPRVSGVPADAVDRAEVDERLLDLLAAPRLVTWEPWGPGITRWMPEKRSGWYGGNPDELGLRAAYWRAVTDPDSGQLRGAIDPGRADRMWLLVQRMAATNVPEAAPDGTT